MSSDTFTVYRRETGKGLVKIADFRRPELAVTFAECAGRIPVSRATRAAWLATMEQGKPFADPGILAYVVEGPGIRESLPVWRPGHPLARYPFLTA
jgi:hypothetical protein